MEQFTSTASLSARGQGMRASQCANDCRTSSAVSRSLKRSFYSHRKMTCTSGSYEMKGAIIGSVPHVSIPPHDNDDISSQPVPISVSTSFDAGAAWVSECWKTSYSTPTRPVLQSFSPSSTLQAVIQAPQIGPRLSLCPRCAWLLLRR
jgi:hypothetical protein